ncbi:MAG: multiheme c-type cytochrome [Phycisphaerales bacterium]|nr:multiheme c-type cytochrome [Phycisphaerales bacterium]
MSSLAWNLGPQNTTQGEIDMAAGSPTVGRKPTGARRKYVPVVGPRLRVVLMAIFALFALLAVNSVYLVSVSVLGWTTGQSYENWFYLIMFLVHLILGLIIVVPVIVFGLIHMKNARNRPNRRAVRAGYALFATALLLLISGIVLMRIDGVIVIKNPTIRAVAYWAHVISPLAVVWLFTLHRLAGRGIRWRVGGVVAAVAACFAVLVLIFQAQDPRAWNVEGNPDGDQYFFPSLARTVSGDFIHEEVLQNDEYCLECHADVHDAWSHSAHRFSSFNNPAYLFSVRQTREHMLERDGTVNGSRFCAGCHDPVPFFSGSFNDPNYDDENDPTSQAGITCTVCHSISHVNSVQGNADYTIDEPVHYPFATSKNSFLQWVNRQLIKAKPAFHKKTFLKPLHSSTEFCGTCHKVHLPPEVNDYKWLRGQNHYDAFYLSGVSGQGVSSFYYPQVAETNCNSCHMPLVASDDFGARPDRDESGEMKVHDHMFPSANTAIPAMIAARDPQGLEMRDPDAAIKAHQEFLDGVLRVDIFGVRENGKIDGKLVAPLRPEIPILEPGRDYLFEIVIRTVKMGHTFTQGTADSNEVWLDVTASIDEEVIGQSGSLDPVNNAVDPWSHFVNSFVLDREGNRINRRNAEDIFTALYNHQIPPGAADTVHYRLHVPEDATGAIELDVKLLYRKFDTEYMALIHGDYDFRNELPITVLATDRITLPVAGQGDIASQDEPLIPTWQRWNDYGIGLLRKPDQGQLRQAEEAFEQVESLGRPDGPINLARVYLNEGRVTEDAPAALQRARDFDPPAREWSLLWFSGLVNKQNGNLDEAINNFQQIVDGGFEQAAGRGFDFSKDYRMLNELAGTLYERAKQERGPARRDQRVKLMDRALGYLLLALEYDPENATSHYLLKQIYTDLGNDEQAMVHAEKHAYYKVDDNAREQAITAARMKYPAADHAAESVVIYDLDRETMNDESTGP